MASIVKINALTGSHDESPHCYLLQIDEFRILLDLGWDEFFDPKLIKDVQRVLPQVDVVLLSYPDPLHLGAYPRLRNDIKCPVYATVPVYKMGQLFMYDMHQSHHNMGQFTMFSLDDVDEAFDRITQVKYNQTIFFKDKGLGISVTPLPAGHMIGGTVWRITKDGEEDIIYAVDYNHKRERHLNGCALDSIQRPSLLITDAFNAMYHQPRRRTRDEQLLTIILQTVRRGGNVLIGVDTAGRVLELAHMLEQLWKNQDSGLMAYSLVMASNVAKNVIDFAKSQVEWMSDKIMRSFEGARNNPFHFKYLIPCHSHGQIQSVPDPKVVLASMPDLEAGYARDLFLLWAGDERHSVVLTSRSSPGTLGRRLIDEKPERISVLLKQRIPLEGEELEDHLNAERLKREKTLKEDLSSSEESDIELDDPSNPDITDDNSERSKTHEKQVFFHRAPRRTHLSFPLKEDKIKWDDYGEVMKHDPFLNISHHVRDSSDILEANFNEAVPIVEVPSNEVPLETTEIPTKCIQRQVDVKISCKISYIDFEGRSDGESIRQLVHQMKPKRLVIIRGGNEQNTESFYKYCISSGCVQDNRVFAPRQNEIVDATTESHIYQVKLKESLLLSLKFCKAKNAELAWLDAEISEPLEDSSVASKDADVGKEQTMVLQPVSISAVPHGPLFMNDLKLSDFKQVLMKHGITAEFSGGVLYCHDCSLAVKRTEAGRLILEGSLNEDYFRIRELLYDQYAIL